MNNYSIFDVTKYMWKISTRKNRTIITGAVMFLFLAKICTSFTPYIFKMIIDALTSQQGINMLPIYIGLYGLVRVCAEVINQCKEVSFSYAAQFITRVTSVNIFQHIHSLSLDYHLSKKTGEFLRVMDQGVKALETIFSFSSMILLPSIVETLLITFIVTKMYGLQYAAILLIVVLVYI